MTIEHARPTTLAGIKSLANRIKRVYGLQHHDALDKAAQQASFANFQHAQRRLPVPPKTTTRASGSVVVLTVYWIDAKSGATGRESLCANLNRPLSAIGRPAELRRSRYLAPFRFCQPDHLVETAYVSSQSAARRRICAGVRALTFMDATGLKPARSHRRAYEFQNTHGQLPGEDHSSLWVDQTTGSYVIADEPYAAAETDRHAERANWASSAGMLVVKSKWGGMYAPDADSQLFLVAPVVAAGLVKQVMHALGQLAPPLVEAAWQGDSGPERPAFATDAQRARSGFSAPYAPANPTLLRSGPKTTPYALAVSGRGRRPSQRMPLEAHAQAAKLMGLVLAETSGRQAVQEHLNAVRSLLDDWVQVEYDRHEMPNEVFDGLYYAQHRVGRATAISIDSQQVSMMRLAQARSILVLHYPDCQPLRGILRRIDAAQRSLARWTPNSRPR